MAKRSKSIRTKLVLPLIIIMSIQAVLFLALVLFGGVFKNLKTNAIDILQEKTENRRLYLEKEMVHRWINVIADTDVITDEIQQVLDSNGKNSEDIKKDPELNRRITETVTQQLIDLLHRSYATGIFIVLDGPAALKQQEMLRSGVYIRDLDTSSYNLDNSDLLLERGLPSVAKSYGIALDSFWELGYRLEEGQENSNFFYRPFQSAVDHQAGYRDAVNFGYLNKEFSLSEMDQAVITYSLPLILKDGSIIGVVGLDMTMSQIQSLMDYSELEENGNGIFVLGVRQAGSDTIQKVETTGGLYNRFFSGMDELEYRYSSSDQVDKITSKDGSEWYAAVKKLDIYANNTPFENDEWVLAGMVERDRLLDFYDSTRTALLISLLVPIFLSFLGVSLASNAVTVPIRKLVGELRANKDYSRLSLNRLNISEIDELTEAIETLSQDVAQSASRISTILENANVPIGVFEIRANVNQVFCSRSLCEMLGWGELEETYVYMDQDLFKSRLEAFKLKYREWEQDIYYIPEHGPKWLKLITVEQDGGRLLGVLSDVTGEMRERIKLERERDYDILTNIYNRRAFREKIEHLIDGGRYSCAAMVMWDLDNLKYINDTYGHDEGDRYIKLFAKRLHFFENSGIISRYSGDEFVTFLYSEGGKEQIRSRMNEFMNSLKDTTMVINGYAIPLRVSAGLAWYPDNARTFDLLVNYADFAMYTVKHSVKGIAMEFDPQSYSDNSYLLSGREELNRMFEQRRVDFAFQPIVRRDGSVYGYEILMRPKLKNLKGINEILNLARVQAKLPQMEELTWRAGLSSFDAQVRSGNVEEQAKIFINSIASTSLPDSAIRELEGRYWDYLSRVVIEMTESEPLDDSCLNHKIEMAKKWNAMIAIDDFGAGYNSEAVLLQIDPDIVKLDMKLVRSIDEDLNRQMLLKNIMEYTRKRGILILAEGVETEAELKFLLECGVDFFQGFYLARPELEIRPVSPYVIQKMKTLQMKNSSSSGAEN